MKKFANLIALGVTVAMILLIVIVSAVGGEGFSFVSTPWAILPPVIAIGLALITKEVYSSLFVGILLGGLMAANCSFTGTLDNVVIGGLSDAVAGSAGIFVFLVILGVVVAIVNRAGAAQAFGKWAEKHVHTKVGAAVATFALGVLVFIDDYFNCLTVGSVMSPVTDSHKISRVKLAYLIDATAAPVCMIAPISSWAAAVSGALNDSGMDLDALGTSSIGVFINAIPYNFYSLLTFAFILILAFLGFDYGKMADFEIKAQNGDLSVLESNGVKMEEVSDKGIVWDLLVPIIILIVACVGGLAYNGYQACVEEGLEEITLAEIFGHTDAYVGLPWGGVISLILIGAYMIIRRVLTFKDIMDCLPKGFNAMVPAILILTLATALKNMTGMLEIGGYINEVMENAGALTVFLPAITFVIACVLAFATGTSWGTFGILIPIVVNVFQWGDPLFYVGVSACLAGAVCGDHCSPISDTTIMASAGANCNHLDHVETQLPYAITVAAVSFVSYLLAGVFSLFGMTVLSIPAAFILLVATLLVIRTQRGKKA